MRASRARAGRDSCTPRSRRRRRPLPSRPSGGGGRERVALAEVFDELVALEQVGVPAARRRSAPSSCGPLVLETGAPTSCTRISRSCSTLSSSAWWSWRRHRTPQRVVARPFGRVERAPRRGDGALRVGDGRVGGGAEHLLGRRRRSSRRSRRPRPATSSPSISSRSSCQIVTRVPPRLCRLGRTRWYRLDRTITVAENALSRQTHAAFSPGAHDSRSPCRMPIAEFRTAARTPWLDAHHDELAPAVRPAGNARRAHRADAAGEVASSSTRAGCARGWPERVGGLGGSPMLRTELGAALAGAGSRRSRASSR